MAREMSGGYPWDELQPLTAHLPHSNTTAY